MISIKTDLDTLFKCMGKYFGVCHYHMFESFSATRCHFFGFLV